jgi:trimethylamine--corrinoid protein Co-methyltransferase
MNLAAGRRYRLMQQVLISPLRLNDEGLDVALQFLGRADVEVGLAGSIPMLGVTCPIEPRAALVQALAEELGFAIVREALTGEGGIGCPRVEPFDMRDGTIVFGSPEWCLLRAMVFQAYEFVAGLPLRGGAFRSVAKQPDPQAAAERTASVLWQALLGSRRFGAVGQLSVDEVFSPQQVVIDEEILRYVERVAAGLAWENEGDALAAISEGIAEGSFAGLEATARSFRGFYSFPDLFRHWNVARWQAEGARSVLSVAWDRARAQIAQSSYRLPDEQAREVERIFRRASAHVRGPRG